MESRTVRISTDTQRKKIRRITVRYKESSRRQVFKHFEHSIASTKSLADMYAELRRLRGLGPRGRLPPEHQDLLWLPRSAVMAALSSLDSYVHSVLYDRIPRTLRHNPIPDKLCEAMAKIIPIKNANTFRNAFGTIATINVYKTLTEKLDGQTLSNTSYQSPKGIIDAYAMIGFPDVFESVSSIWSGPKSSSDDIKRQLANYVNRRNQIVHEGDREKSGKIRPIQSEYAINCTNFIRNLVSRLNRVVYD